MKGQCANYALYFYKVVYFYRPRFLWDVWDWVIVRYTMLMPFILPYVVQVGIKMFWIELLVIITVKNHKTYKNIYNSSKSAKTTRTHQYPSSEPLWSCCTPRTFPPTPHTGSLRPRRCWASSRPGTSQSRRRTADTILRTCPCWPASQSCRPRYWWTPVLPPQQHKTRSPWTADDRHPMWATDKCWIW